MKKIVVALVLISSLFFAGTQVWAWSGGCQGCPMAAGGENTANVNPEAYQKFIDSTAQLRLDLAAKRGEYEAVLAQTNPDPKQAGQVSREIAEIQSKIQLKAKEQGLPAWGQGNGFCKGQMEKRGCGKFQKGGCLR